MEEFDMDAGDIAPPHGEEYKGVIAKGVGLGGGEGGGDHHYHPLKS